MNVVSLYVATTRYILRSDPHDPDSWSDLYRYLPYLRQALSCCVCTNILCIPMGPIETICQHHVCQNCIGGKMRLRPSCSWCKDYNQFIENTQLRIIVRCFKGICDYLSTTAIARNLANTNNGGTNAIMTIIRDGRNVRDDYSQVVQSPGFSLFPAVVPLNNPPSDGSHAANQAQGQGRYEVRGSDNNANSEVGGSDNNANSDDSLQHQRNGNSTSGVERNVNSSAKHLGSRHGDHHHARGQNSTSDTELSERISQTVAQEHDYNKDSSLLNESSSQLGDSSRHKARRTGAACPRRRPRHGSSFSDGLSDENGPPASASETQSSASDSKKPRIRGQKKSKLKIGCRCGLATPTPGKLTCCGQRCPCYSSFKGCIPDCRCRGCRNPRPVPQVYLHSTKFFHNNNTNTDSDDSDIEIDV